MAPEEVDELDDERGDFDHGSEIQPSESESEMEVVEEDPIQDEDEEDELEDGKDDELEEEDAEENSEGDELSASPAGTAEPGPSLPSKLRIKLKLPAQGHTSKASSSRAGGSSRRRYARGSDIESEDSDEDEASTRSTSVATTGTPGRPLTARQAVLRNVVDSSHVSLIEPPNPRKKKPLTEIEIALKREETARKRRNLTEKKLEDEKAETINRLLKKQSRARGKRNALSTAEDRPTPLASVYNNGMDAEVDDVGEEGSATPVLPSMYRWISTTRVPGAKEGDEPKAVLSFSVPVFALAPSEASQPTLDAMDLDKPANPLLPPATRPQCDVEGCSVQRKYRLVQDWHRGACSMIHLKHLEQQITS